MKHGPGRYYGSGLFEIGHNLTRFRVAPPASRSAESLALRRFQLFERGAGRLLLRVLLARPGRARERLAAYDDFHLEQLAVIGPQRVDAAVLRQRLIARLQQR